MPIAGHLNALVGEESRIVYIHRLGRAVVHAEQKAVEVRIRSTRAATGRRGCGPRRRQNAHRYDDARARPQTGGRDRPALAEVRRSVAFASSWTVAAASGYESCNPKRDQ